MRSPNNITSLVFTLVLTFAGCWYDYPARNCDSDADCLKHGVEGICLESPVSAALWCAFPDVECSSGYSYGPLTGDGLSDVCVVSLPLDGGTDGSQADAEHPCPLEGMPCVTGEDGVCGPGHYVCSGGEATCVADSPAMPESCNDVDDDCDGAVDDGVTMVCGTDVGECVAGVSTCANGEWGTCVGEVAAVAEDCNGGDEDCDGMSDEDCSCMDGTVQPCGSDVGSCEIGLQECEGGAWGACIGEVAAGPEECANTYDDDCDGVVNDGCPADVQAQFPWNGYATGSPWATAASLPVKSLRPTFRWVEIASATHYELEVDDSCSATGFSGCGFPSPEVTESVFAASFTPTADLSVAMIAPVGRRYFWRVRGCNAVGC